MKKLILASVSALALFGIAACSDSSTDTTTTQSTNPPAAEQPMTPTAPDPNAAPPATDNSTTQSITPAPSDGAADDSGATPVQPAAPAQ
jgi:hypothetical protein